MRSFWIRVSPKFKDKGRTKNKYELNKKDKKEDIETQKRPSEDGGRDWNYAATSQRIPRSHQKEAGRCKEVLSLRVFGERHLDLDLVLLTSKLCENKFLSF